MRTERERERERKRGGLEFVLELVAQVLRISKSKIVIQGADEPSDWPTINPDETVD